LFPTESAHVWSSNDWALVELIGYWLASFYPDHTRSLHDHFPINSTSSRPTRSLDFSIATQLFWQSKIIV